MFKEYELVVENIILPVRHSDTLKPVQHEVESEADKFITPLQSLLFLQLKSLMTLFGLFVWWIMCYSKKPLTDDYGHIIPPRINFLQENFLEKVSSSKLYIICKCSENITFSIEKYQSVFQNQTCSNILSQKYFDGYCTIKDFTFH